MATIKPTDFIKNVLVDEIGEIHQKHPYIAFVTMAIGIEFLGKCLNTHDDWNQSGQSKADFELAINSLHSFDKYRPLLVSHKLWDSLRNGFTHAFVPKGTITLSSGTEAPHSIDAINPIVNLKCEDFYGDFRDACNEVIGKTFTSGKMTRDLMVVPDPVSSGSTSSGTSISYSGTTTP